MLGLAWGDALGASIELKKKTFPSVKDMQTGGKFNVEKGQWTEDTSMTLCIAESFLECKEFNPIDQLQRYQK